jgi:hypothetical protein
MLMMVLERELAMYQIHVYVRDPASGLSWWRAVHPSGSNKPYRYETREEAERMARLCYDADPTTVRVVEE